MFFNDSTEKKKCPKCGYLLVAPFPLHCQKCNERIPGVEEPKKKTITTTLFLQERFLKVMHIL